MCNRHKNKTICRKSIEVHPNVHHQCVFEKKTTYIYVNASTKMGGNIHFLNNYMILSYLLFLTFD